MRLLCLTNLFPDASEPWRGLDNVTLLHAMRAERPEADIRVLALRPSHRYWIGQAPQLTPRPGDEGLQPSFHHVPYLPKFGGWNDRLYALAIARALRTLPAGWRPDALLVPWLFPDACAVHRLRELAQLPLLAIAQGSDVHQYLAMPLRRSAILHLAQRARIATRSEDLRQHLLAAGADSGRVSTIYNGVDTATFRPGDPAAARRALNLPETGKLLLFVGNFLPVKGLDLLIGAAAALRRERDLHLVLIGGGPLEPALRAQAETSGLGSANLTFAGRRAAPEVAEYMRAADAVCLSSLNEGVPNVLLEAFASGRPLVSTRVGGIAEITQPSPGGGFLAAGREIDSYAACLRQALDSPPDARALSAYAARFSWSHCAQACWQKLLDAPA